MRESMIRSKSFIIIVLQLNDFSRVGGEFVAPSRNAQPLRNEAKQMTD